MVAGEGQRANGRGVWLLSEALLAATVLILALWTFGRVAGRVAYDGDEGFYIWETRYFSYLFLQHDVTRPEWGDTYATHTQPMMAAYVIGGWLWARGYDPQALPERSYDYSKSL